VCRSALQNETGTTHRSFPTGKGEKYMKATGIVRRVEECVIIGQTARNPHKHYDFRWFAPLNALVSKQGFGGFYT